MIDPLLIAFGLGVGILVGTTGMGGGSLMTPLLILVAGVKPTVAVGTDLAYAAVTKTVGGWKHIRQRTVDMRLSAWMALGSVPAGIGGVYVLERFDARPEFENVLIAAIAAALLLSGTAVLVRALFLPALVKRERARLALAARHKVIAVAVGVFVGFILGVTSAGSVAPVAVALILLFRFVPTRVVGTDVFHAAILLWAAAAAHIVGGNVDWALAGTILLGSVPGVLIGSHWSVRVPIAGLRTMLAIVLVASGLALLSKAGVSIPPSVLVAVPVALAVLAYALYMVSSARAERLDRAGATAERMPGERRRSRHASAKALKPYVAEVRAEAIRSFSERYPGLQFAPVVVVIAAYNEDECIGGVLEAIPPEACGLPVDTLVVDDGSADRTTDVSLEHGVHVATLKGNCGHGVALRLGYQLAREHGGRYIVTLDADGQWDPVEIPDMLEPLVADEADFVIGSRVLGRAETDDSFRQAGVHVFARLVRLLTGVAVTDTSTGFRAMRAEVTATVRQEQVQYQTSELLIGAIYQGYRIVERPVVMHKRAAGESKKGNNVLYGFRYARVILKTWWRERRAAKRVPRAVHPGVP